MFKGEVRKDQVDGLIFKKQPAILANDDRAIECGILQDGLIDIRTDHLSDASSKEPQISTVANRILKKSASTRSVV